MTEQMMRPVASHAPEPIIVEIEGIGELEFPGDTDPSVIEAKVKELTAPKGRDIAPDVQQLYESMPYLKKVEEGILGGGAVTAAPTIVGQAAQQFAPAVSATLRKGAERLYGGLLKAKDTTIERFPNVVRDLVAARVPISHSGRRRVVQDLRRIGSEKQTLLTEADKRAMVPRATLREGLDDVLEGAIQNSDAPVKDLNKLAKIERELIPDELGVLPSRADRIKSKLQSESDRALRQMRMGTRVSDTTARAKTSVANRAKEAVEAIEPRMKDVNARYASGKGQAEALRETLKRTDKHSLVGMSDVLGGVAGATSAGPLGIPAGIAIMRLLNNPRTGSHVALMLGRMANVPQIDQASKMALLALMSGREE
jgi:hypothetical protein